MAIKYVNGTSGDDSNDGDSAAGAYATIARAVSVISSGTGTSTKNTIVVHSGTYAEGPITTTKDFISLTTAGDGLVSIKHAGASTGNNNTLEIGENWDLTGNSLDLAIFTKQLDGGTTVSHDGPVYAVKLGTHGDPAHPFTASSVAFVGQKYLKTRDDITHTQESFGDAFDVRPYGTASNCVFMHLSKVGGSSASTARLSLLGSLIFNTGMTSSTGNGVYVPHANSDFINNTFSHCTGGAYLVRFPAAKMMNNLFTDCVAYGVSVTDSDNFFLDDDSTTILGNAVHNLHLIRAAGDSQLWETSTPSNQMSSSITNIIPMPTASLGYPAGWKPGTDLLVTPNKCYSEDGIFPGSSYSNAIFYSLPITASILPHGGRSLNHAGENRSTLIHAEGIASRTVRFTGPATDLLGIAWDDEANPPVGCFAQYVEFAKEPEEGRDKIVEHHSLGRDTVIVIQGHDEERKSTFRNIDAPTFNKSAITAAGLRGRHTIYRVTTTKS